MNKVECIDLVERVTDYLEGALAPDVALDLTVHLGECDGCEAYVGQYRTTVRLLAELPREQLSIDMESILLAKYRERSQSVTL